MHSQGHTSTQVHVHTSTRPKASIHRLRMQRFFSSAASSSAGSAERPATAWQLQEIQEERQCAHGNEPYANGHGNELYPDAHRPQPDADAHGPTTFPHDPPPNGLWFFLVPNPAPAPPLPPPHRATSESGGASTAFMGSRYIDSDEATIEGAAQDASMMMQREHHPRRQSSDPKRCKDIKKQPTRGRDGSSHTRRA